MAQTFRFRHLVNRWDSPVLRVVSVLFLVGAAGCSARLECQNEPADEFSEKIDSLLTAVEGSDFPSAANLDAWQERRGDIQAGFAEILELTSGDDERRRAAIAALLAAESLAASPKESRRLVGTETGEMRAWTRHVLKGYSLMGVTPEDWKLVDRSLLKGLQGAWDNEEVQHPQKNLPFYQEKAAALRGLARFQESPSCAKKL